jgi:hypothetical protein
MKNLMLIILIFFYFNSYSQISLDVDTLKGADTVYQSTPLMKSAYSSIMFQVSYDTLVGEPTGYSVLQGSVDGLSWATIETQQYTVYATNNDTMNYNTIGVNIWALSGLPFNYLRSMNIGSTGDTLLIKSVYQTKKY